jgi:hypothetical protein
LSCRTIAHAFFTAESPLRPSAESAGDADWEIATQRADALKVLLAGRERRSLLEKWNQENLASMTPFERYLFDNGLFDDVIRPEITADDVILEPGDHCIDVGCEHCISYWKHEGRVSYCTHDCHKNFRAPEVPYLLSRFYKVSEFPSLT